MINPNESSDPRVQPEEPAHLSGGEVSLDWPWQEQGLPPTVTEEATVHFTKDMPVVVLSMTPTMAKAVLEMRVRLAWEALLCSNPDIVHSAMEQHNVLCSVAEAHDIDPRALSEQFLSHAHLSTQDISTALGMSKSRAASLEMIFSIFWRGAATEITLESAIRLEKEHGPLEAALEEIRGK